MSMTARLLASALLFAMPATVAMAEDDAPLASLVDVSQAIVGVGIDSGSVAPPAGGQALPTDLHLVFSTDVQVAGSDAVRLIFKTTKLAAATAQGGDTYMLITSLADGHQQVLTPKTLREWKYTSAYFNGDSVHVEIYSPTGADASRVVIAEAISETSAFNPAKSICGPTDDRVLSSDPRSGRVWPIGCTAWLFDGRPNCLNTAGHCGPANDSVIQFNVPLSTSGGTPQHPGPDDQYAVDPVSIQSNGGQGIGNDWSTFGVFNNANTGLSPLVAQGGTSHTLAAAAPGGTGQPIRVTGYGSTTSPVSPTWYLAQKTHAGPYAGVTGTNIQYSPDTSGGNSGSAVQDDSTGLTIGIHTHAGCNSGGGANNGTAVQHAAFQNALANPLGICAFGLDLAIVGERPTMLETGEAATVTVQVNANGVTLDSGTIVLHVDNGAGFVAIPMTSTGPDTYEGTFSAEDCDFDALFYVSAMDTTGDSYFEPTGGSASPFSASVADEYTTFASFNFETDPLWTVANTALTTGAWVRDVPRAEGRGDPLADFDGSGQCWVTGNGLSEDVDGGPTSLITAPIDLSAASDPVVTYARWFDTNATVGTDNLLIQFSDNGGASWVTVENLGDQDGWNEVSFRVLDYVGLTSQFQVRFSATDNPNNSVTEAAIDAFRVVDESCNNTPACTGDIADDFGNLGADGMVSFGDFLALLGLIGPCPGGTPGCTGDIADDFGNLGADGMVSFGDFLALLGLIGPCP